MEQKEKVLQVQKLTNDYFKTAEILDLSYGYVRYVCEENEEVNKNNK